jgi:N-acetylmuramoyl-L-alanine amidase
MANQSAQASVAVARRSTGLVGSVLGRFGMLLDVRRLVRNDTQRRFSLALVFIVLSGAAALSPSRNGFPVGSANAVAPQAPQGSTAPATQQSSVPSATTPLNATGTQGTATQNPAVPPRLGVNIVVLDPAHGGTDSGARGTGGIHESDIVLEFAAQVRAALESQGFQVVQTRQGNANPSFDDRSAMANAQRGAIFVTLHIASTGTPGTARVYVMNDLPTGADATGLIPWDRAQAPFVSLSRKLGDQVQILLAQRFKGSPSAALTASVRQLRTTAAPAIAVEISSVTVEDRAQLDHMVPGVADAIARGAAIFRPAYVVPANPGERP